VAGETKECGKGGEFGKFGKGGEFGKFGKTWQWRSVTRTFFGSGVQVVIFAVRLPTVTGIYL